MDFRILGPLEAREEGRLVRLGSTGRALGMLATVLGRFADATRHYDDALEMNRSMGARP